MDDVATWINTGIAAVTGAVAVAAAAYSWLSNRKSAQAKAGLASVEKSLQLISQSFGGVNGPTAAESLARIADALEIREAQQDELSETPRGRLDSSTPRGVRLPAFNVEYVSGHSYRIRNVGAAPASDVTVTVPGFPDGLTRSLPVGIDLAPVASSAPFIVQGASGAPTPGEIVISAAELPDQIHVALPPRS